MSIYPTDTRVRYAPELGVWAMTTGASYAAGADQILGAMMVYAERSGVMPEGCTCGPETVGDHFAGIQTSEPRAHRIGSQGGTVLYGHGPVGYDDPGSEEANALHCPLANREGEERARDLGKTGRWEELHALTVPFPDAPTQLQPAAPGTEAPAVWEGEPVTMTRMTVPDRHVHPDTRADLERLSALAARSGELDRAARAATRDAENAGTDARRLAADAAASGTPMDAAAVTRTIRERQDQAQAAQITADGTRDAMAQVRRQVAAGIEQRQAEWLTYLHGQAAAGLARLDLVVAELDAAVANLAEIDRVRQTVEAPSPGLMFTAGSFIAGNVVEAARQTRQSAAEALAGLERHAAKAAREKASQPA
ncbi:hypothetical protein AB0283_05035 [Micromonospora vinacea]|uniref:hypothetical protein n=1 Tax=Micromonospora vinacea TaxID=709878 RepID=UPI00344B60CA